MQGFKIADYHIIELDCHVGFWIVDNESERPGWRAWHIIAGKISVIDNEDTILENIHLCRGEGIRSVVIDQNRICVVVHNDSIGVPDPNTA